MTRKTAIAFLLFGTALTLGVTACGGGSSSSSNEPPAAISTGSGTTTGDGGTASGTLNGEDGPGFTIEVSQNGQDAETVRAGTYTLHVEDKSAMHNFHLIGPGVDEIVTEVPFVGEKTVTVTLEKGTYTYQCDPHAASGMKGTFTVT